MMRIARRFVFLLLLIPFPILFITGRMGIDFGRHWDEPVQINLVQNTLRTGILLPNWYNYPSVSYWLTLDTLAPHVLFAIQKVGIDWRALGEHLTLVAATPAYLLQARTLFLLLSALAVIWTGLAARAMGSSWAEALVSAGILGLSWEVGYHARWIAPDAVLMQFVALTLLLSIMAVRRPAQRGWLIAAASAAGLATGTKYPGGLTLLIPLAAAWLIGRADRLNANGRRSTLIHVLLDGFSALASTLPVFGLAYLISTPGTLLDPINFTRKVVYEVGHYAGGGPDQTVPPGLPHLWLILNYYARVLFSHYQPLALILFACAFLGIYAMLRSEHKSALLALPFPLIYVFYFSLQRVMIARNLLAVAPFLALLAGRGVIFMAESIPGAARTRRILQLAWYGVILIILGVNAVWLFSAARSIQARGADAEAREAADYLRANPGRDFVLSEKVYMDLSRLSEGLPANARKVGENQSIGMENPPRLVFYASEGITRGMVLPSNWPGLAERYFGSWEVNFDYYPLWAGDDRILVMPLDQARRIGIRAAP
jgi:4-amino-4-deoxy-L-arabinose transferase-like glycosyltransferase